MMRSFIRKSLQTLLLCLSVALTHSQQLSLNLDFSAENESFALKLDSTRVWNHSSGETFLVTWPDTSLTILMNSWDTLLLAGYSSGIPVTIHDFPAVNPDFTVLPNFPNPVNSYTFITINMDEPGNLGFSVSDETGSTVLSANHLLGIGKHTFRFIPGNSNFYVFSASTGKNRQSLKIPVTGHFSSPVCFLEYAGSIHEKTVHKSTGSTYSVTENEMESGILDSPNTDKSYIFNFITGLPCPGVPTVTYEGQTYNTIQIFSQCWLKENLNVGNMIQITESPSDNGIIEKFCYENQPDSCAKYGGYYEWREAMQYSLQQGTRGICPTGWHIPTDGEWKILEAVVDSETGLGDPVWDELYYRGTDNGINLKAGTEWQVGGNGSDAFGYSALPGGNKSFCGHFFNSGYYGYWWTSTTYDTESSWYRSLSNDNPSVNRYRDVVASGFSVRCLKD